MWCPRKESTSQGKLNTPLQPIHLESFSCLTIQVSRQNIEVEELKAIKARLTATLAQQGAGNIDQAGG